MASDFDSSIASYDQSLSELKFPTEAWLSDPGVGFDLGYAPVDGKWMLAVRTHAGIVTPLSKASKGVRIDSVNYLAKVRALVECPSSQP
jgi:hypothetical protein